jgi:hypothetical protein
MLLKYNINIHKHTDKHVYAKISKVFCNNNVNIKLQSLTKCFSYFFLESIFNLLNPDTKLIKQVYYKILLVNFFSHQKNQECYVGVHTNTDIHDY